MKIAKTLIALATLSLSVSNAFASPVTYMGAGGISVMNNPNLLNTQVAPELAAESDLLKTKQSKQEAALSASTNLSPSQLLIQSAQNTALNEFLQSTGTGGVFNLPDGGTITTSFSGNVETFYIVDPGHPDSSFSITHN